MAALAKLVCYKQAIERSFSWDAPEAQDEQGLQRVSGNAEAFMYVANARLMMRRLGRP